MGTFSFADAVGEVPETPAPKTFSFADAVPQESPDDAVSSTLKVLKAVGQGYPVVEAAANFASQFPAMAAGGLAGIATGGNADTVRQVVESLTYEPRSEGGKLLAAGGSYPYQKLGELADVVGNKAMDIPVIGGPALATAVNTAIQAAPMLLGVRRGGKAEAVAEKPAEVAAEAPKPEVAPEAPKTFSYAEAVPEAKVEAPAPKAEVAAEPRTFSYEDAAKEPPRDMMEEVRAIRAQQDQNTAALGPDMPKTADGTIRYSDLSYEQLDELHQRARAQNNAAELSAVSQYMGPKALAEYASKKSIRSRDNWWNDNATKEVQDAVNRVAVDEETIAEHRAAVNDFDTESPEMLGRSLTSRVKNIDKPGFENSPDFTAMQNGLRYAKEQGWNLDEVTGGMRRRAVELYGNDAPEMMDRLFRPQEAPKAEAPPPVAALKAPPETVDLGIGIDPLKQMRESYSPYVGVEQTPRTSTPIGDSILKVIAPASRGLEAGATADIVRANLGKQAQEREVALHNLKTDAAMFDKMPVADNYAFIDAMEGGQKLADPKLQKSADSIRALLDDKRAQVSALGKGALDNYIENYFPHIWQQPASFASFISRRPLEGSKGFLKQRTYDTFADGLAAGLKPISANPVELALLKAREMDRYIYGQKIFAEMKDQGLAKFVKFGEQAPDGWTRVNDKIARVMFKGDQGMVLAGEYYAPEQAATIINNHLSPGLQGIGAYDMARRAGMMMNAAQLGLSAFHLGFTTLDAMVSKAALGIKQVSRGDVLKGVGNMAQSLNPAQPFMNLYKGSKLLRAYLGDLKDPGLAPIVQAFTEGGGRVRMDDFYRNATVNGFKQALRQGQYVRAGKELLPTILDRMNAPIFQYLVPLQKNGVMFDMAKDALERYPNMDQAMQRKVMGRLWDSVDNRMGELVYDNLFWNRALKDSLMLSVRSVGWNLGTFRELGGGILDLKDVIKNKGLSDRSAYVIALPFVTGVLGSVINYLYTGQAPRDFKDMIFPRTGRIRPDGTEDRLSLPSYMKDLYEYAHDPVGTLKNKANPLPTTVGQMLENKDFFGAQIRNPQAPFVRQMAEEATFLSKQMTPFGVRNFAQQQKAKNKSGFDPLGYITSPSFYGLTPAPAYVTKNAAQQENAAILANKDSVIKRYREDLKNGGDVQAAREAMRKAGLTPGEINGVVNSSRGPKAPQPLRSYKP